MLYPNLVVAHQEQGHRNEPLPQVDEDQENRRPKRKHTTIERYEACPSKDLHQMYNNRSDDYRRSNKQKLAIRPRATDFLAGMKKNEARRRSFAVDISNESTLNLPRGGTSKSAKSKHQKALGSVAMGSIHALFQEQDATTPQKFEHSKQVVAYFQKQVEEQESRIRSKK